LISVFVIFLISSFAIAQDEISPEEKSLLTLIALKWSNQCKENGLRADVKGCFTCHYDPRDFKKVRKVSLEIPRMYPAGSNMKLSADGKTVTCLVYEVNKVQWDIIRWTMEGKDYENVERIVLEIASVGGSLFDAIHICSILEELKSKNIIVETRVYGFAYSAAFLLAVSGTKGERYVSPIAQLMWHEISQSSQAQQISSSMIAAQANLMARFQKQANSIVVENSKISQEKLEKLLREKGKESLWINGREAVKYGFADKPIYR